MMKKFVMGCFVLCAFAAFAFVPGPLLVPDYDRDGKITDGGSDYIKAHAGEAFTIWLNDDNDAAGTDGGEAGDTNTDLNDVPAGNEHKDCEDNEVNGRCDLLDFFPVLVDVSQVVGWGDMTWKLCSDSVNVVFTGLGVNDAGMFHTQEVKALDGETSLYRAAVTNLAEDVVLPFGFLKDGRGVFLIEGRKRGSRCLKLCGYDGDGASVAEVTLDLRVVDVEKMYGWLNLRPEEGEAKNEDAIERSEIAEGLREQWKVENSTVRLPTTTTTDLRHFILVHGYNTNPDEARGNAAEFYKKLWQSGSDAMFTAVEWRGDQSQTEIFGLKVTPNYFVNVENAFAAARPFADACKKLPGEKILIGHSLGNVLISSAIKDYGLDYTRFVMLNAAIAREAFDASAYDADMVDEDWLGNEVKVEGEGEVGDSLTNRLDWASRWYRNFADRKYDPYEYRRKLAWRGRFANLPRTDNYYSPTDNVLLNPGPNETDPDKYDELQVYNAYQEKLVGTAYQNQKTGFGFWAFSEKMKGTWVIDTINGSAELEGPDAMKCEAGWGVNSNYVKGIGFSPTNTHFTPFLDPRMKTIGMLDILPAETERVRAQHLADAIPAESFAAGANPVATLENVNEEDFIGENRDWPLYEGEEGEGSRTNVWNHSAFREVAFYHTSKFYASLAATGKPRVIIDANADAGKDLLFTVDLADRMVAAHKLDVLAVMTNGTEDVARYRELLDTASEKSVVICAIGTGKNLTNLLEEAPEFVAAAVKELRVVDEAIVPQGWPTKIVVTEARPAFYESKDILADFPAGTLSPAIRKAELDDPTGVPLAGPMAILPLTEGEPITNQTEAAILSRLRSIYRTGNPSVSMLVSGKPEPGLDYNGSELAFKFENIQYGSYAKEDLKFRFTVKGERGERALEPDGMEWDEALGVLTVRFEIPPEDVRAWNVYDSELGVCFENDELGANPQTTAYRQIVQGEVDVDDPIDWFWITEPLEAPTNFVPREIGFGDMPERKTARVETTFRFDEPSPATGEPPEGAAQAAVRIVEDGEAGWKFQFYAYVANTNGSLYRTWWDCNVEDVKPVRNREYTVRFEGFYAADAAGEANTLAIFVKDVADNDKNAMKKVFVGNLVNKDGGAFGTTRLNSVELVGEGEVSALDGWYLANVANANLAKIDGDREYATVAEAVAAAAGSPIRLLHAASWKPEAADLGNPVKLLNKGDFVLDLSCLPANARAVWTDVDGNNGTLTLELVYADTVVYGTIRTAETTDYVEGAVAIRDGKYVYVGDEAGVAAFVEDGVTEVIDHRGKGMVMPGCTDGHSHYIQKFCLANMKGGVLFAGDDDKTNVLQKLEAAARKAQDAGKKSLLGFGWNYHKIIPAGGPTLKELDDVTYGVSAVIFDSSGHSAYCNSECLKRCKIIDGEGNVLINKIDGGLLELDGNGYPTGYVDERVTGYLTRMGGIDPDEIVDDELAETSIRLSQELLLSTGYTIAFEGWSNVMHPTKFYAAANSMDKNGELKIVFPMTYEVEPWQTDIEDEEIEHLASLKETYGTKHVLPEYLKVFMDGCAETKTGAMSKPYKDGTVYTNFWSVDRLAGITRACNERGLVVHTHVMGDVAITETTDAYVKANTQRGSSDCRNCLVHLRNVNANDFQRFADNNISCTAGLTWHLGGAEKELGEILDEDYVNHSYPIKSFFDVGAKVSSHSDFPANGECPQDPFGMMHVAVTGQHPNHPELKPYDTNELVTVEQAFQTLTINGAWQMGLENERGSIRVGKWADFVLADQDVFECATTDIGKTKVVSTWFEGEKVFEAAESVPVTPGVPLGPYRTYEKATNVAEKAVLEPSAEVEEKLGAGSPELRAYCDMFTFGVVPFGESQWAVNAFLKPPEWTNVVESAQAATLQLPIADIAAWRSGDDPIPVHLTNCVPGFYYSLFDGAEVTNIKADFNPTNLNVLCGTEKTVDFPEVTPPAGGTTSGFFTIGVLEVPSFLTPGDDAYTNVAFGESGRFHLREEDEK